MQKIAVDASSSSYQVVVAESLANLSKLYDFKAEAVVIAEDCVAENCKVLNLPLRSVKGGEALKSLEKIEGLYNIFLELGLDRSSCVVAVGGGALTDAVAFAAATYHRGIPCITVPTTLLAQVDASIGGKNGINFGGVKNLIGSIVQPRLVLCDLEFLKTLPKDELCYGMAEVIKAAIIADPSLFSLLKDSYKDILALNLRVLEEVIARAVKVKADIVSRDEKESGERMKLNLGHTIGHALEVSCNLSHGQAVASGMVWEARLGKLLGVTSEKLASEIEDINNLFSLNQKFSWDPKKVTEIILHDKKRRNNSVNFAIPVAIGKVELIAVKIDEIEKYLSNLCIS